MGKNDTDISTTPELEDWTLIEQIKNRSEDAEQFNRYLNVYRAQLNGFLLVVLHVVDEHMREDVLQRFFEVKIVTRKLFEAADPSRGTFLNLSTRSLTYFY